MENTKTMGKDTSMKDELKMDYAKATDKMAEVAKEINSPDKAYWLGFICADGCINKTNNKITLTSRLPKPLKLF